MKTIQVSMPLMERNHNDPSMLL